LKSCAKKLKHMKTRNMKIKFLKDLLPSDSLAKRCRFPLIIVSCLMMAVGFGQSIEYLGNGAYRFKTDFQSSDLHFYLLDDGYHSFDNEFIHTYSNNSIPALPILYHSEPYDQNEPEESSFIGVNEGTFYSTPPSYQFANMVEVKRSWNLVENRNNYFLLMFENSISQEDISGCIEFHYDKKEIEIKEEDILDNYGNSWVSNRLFASSEYPEYTHKIKWSFDNLSPGEQRFIYLPSKCLKEVFSLVKTRGILKIDHCESVLPYNSKIDGMNTDVDFGSFYTLESIVSNFPHDPNCILTNPQCLLPSSTAQNIQYKVYFQNDGIDPVENVYIDLNMYGDFNFDNVKLINSSHNCELVWNDDSIYITFPGIYLSGIKQTPAPPDYNETIGWVEFDICFDDLNVITTDSKCMTSDGIITFDNEMPLPIFNEICTNMRCNNTNWEETNSCPQSPTVQHHIANGLKLTSLNKDSKPLDFSIKPNLASDIITIEGFESQLELNCWLLNANGQKILKVDLNSSKTINIELLPRGIYFLYMNNDLTSQTKRFVKI